MSHFMKVLERHGLGPTKTVDEVLLDQLQSVYQPHLTVGDAVTYLLQQTHLDTFHLDSYGSTEGITSFDFSGAFNTIWSLLLREKL